MTRLSSSRTSSRHLSIVLPLEHEARYGTFAAIKTILRRSRMTFNTIGWLSNKDHESIQPCRRDFRLVEAKLRPLHHPDISKSLKQQCGKLHRGPSQGLTLVGIDGAQQNTSEKEGQGLLSSYPRRVVVIRQGTFNSQKTL